MKKGTLLTITGLLAIGTAFCVNIALAQAPSILGDNTGTLGGVVDISPLTWPVGTVCEGTLRSTHSQ